MLALGLRRAEVARRRSFAWFNSPMSIYRLVSLELGLASTAGSSRGPVGCAVQHDAPFVVLLVTEPASDAFDLLDDAVVSLGPGVWCCRAAGTLRSRATTSCCGVVAHLDLLLQQSTPATDLAITGRFEAKAPKSEWVHFGMRHEDGLSKQGHQGLLVLPTPCRNPRFPTMRILQNDQRTK